MDEQPIPGWNERCDHAVWEFVFGEKLEAAFELNDVHGATPQRSVGGFNRKHN